MSKLADIQDLFTEAKNKFGHIDIVAFLCSHDGRWITSQTIRATGGLV